MGRLFRMGGGDPRYGTVGRTRPKVLRSKATGEVLRYKAGVPHPSSKNAPGYHLAEYRRNHGPEASWPASVREMKANALADALRRPGYEGSMELWREFLAYEYKLSHKGRLAARGLTPKKKRSEWVHVRRYRRRRPHRRA
jgi:hypothetical protein